ncbi:hypothetical protein [Brevibacterium zhoupengii]|uniref:hypothetical protein n=1 Tax=Brevibacterium zhoupengii TaxID=2898795 RepID=UPI001F091734|nr:hypothetical protein [Brevibacterium zhoupengii]
MKLRNFAIAGTVIATLALSACGGTNEYPGEFTVANGDSSFYVGELFRHDTVTVTCTEKSGTITATIAESRTGNTFVTTQPEEGSGLAGGTLTTGDDEDYTWEVSDRATTDDENPFTGDMQSGEPVSWTDTGVLSFGSGLRQATTNSDEGEVRVQIPGQVDCSAGEG